ncbi:MAG: HAD family hydrolase [Erysipelotrichaceae bacterium]
MIKVAIMYDFDQTLCTKNMQEYSLLPKLKSDPASFWQEVSELSKKDNMDSVLAYMYLMLKKAKEENLPLTRALFKQQGNNIEYYPGVVEYFDRINQFSEELGINLQHFIISSGTKEIIEGCSIYNKFTRVFASEFHYDENGQADWPALAINYTGKTQFLFRINKNCLDIYDNKTINSLTAERDIPFSQMIYIGDGLTDVPCMRVVKDNHGYSIAVGNKDDSTLEKLVSDNRVNFTANCDYRQNSKLDRIIKLILQKISDEHNLNQLHIKQ